MVEIYLYSLFAIIAGLLIWGGVKPVRIYQYPFIMGAIFATFIAPQAISLISNIGALTNDALERVLLMCCLCIAMCWLGYRVKPNQRWLERLDVQIDSAKLLKGAIAFVVIAYICDYQISQLPEEVVSKSNWTGIVTIYAFFASLIYPGFAIIFMRTIQRPRTANILLTVFAGLLPLKTIVLYGRRELTTTFIITIGLTLFFHRRYIPPRNAVLALLLFAMVAIPLTGTYRGIARSGEWSRLSLISPSEELTKFIAEGDILELRNGAYMIETTVVTQQYQYGLGYWDSLVFSFVPAQFVGREFKESLMTEQSQADRENLEAVADYTIPSGSTVTAMGDAFKQFGYAGSLFFLLSGILFKHLWCSAVYRASILSQLLYIGLVAPALITVSHGTTRFPPSLVFQIIFVGGLVFYSRKRTPHHVSMARA